MLINLVKKYRRIVGSYEVSFYERSGSHLYFAGKMTFVDGSELHIRMLILDGKTIKYAYHWQGKTFIRRWDNAPHWEAVSTFPHHVHELTAEGAVAVRESNSAGDIKMVLEEINAVLSSVKPDKN